jgi:drug/metabolite transporter (DMT)-like permease
MRLPAFVVGLGALALSSSAVLISLAALPAPAAAFYRCALALVALGPLAVCELRRHGRLDARLVGSAVVSGAFLGADYLMWNVSIGDVGAGIATVLVNLQVVVFPLVMTVLTRIPLARRFRLAVPVLLMGVALAGGVVGPVPAEGEPVRGTLLAVAAAVAYSGYLVLNRRSGQQAPAHVVTPVFLATAAATALAGVVGAGTTGIPVHLPATSWLWLSLLAVFGQAVPWVLLARGLPLIAPAVSSTLLLLQPVGAVLLGAVVLGEAPTAAQLLGCGLVLVTVWFATTPTAAAADGRRRGPGPLSRPVPR